MAQINLPAKTSVRRRTRTYDADVIGAVLGALTPTGALIPTLSTADPGEGWKACTGQALEKSDFPDLYAAIGGQFGETGTTFNLPDLRGRSVLGAGGTVGLALAAFAGSATQTLAVDQLPAHNHPITDPGHDHVFQGDPHTHTVTDPGHDHTVTDPGHDHLDEINGSQQELVNAGMSTVPTYDAAARTSTETTGITIDTATTGLTVDPQTAGGTVQPSTTGITVGDTGAGQPFDIIPPVLAVNWWIRT